MLEDIYEFYGYRVVCEAPAEAESVISSLFGAPLEPSSGHQWPGSGEAFLSVELVHSARGRVIPPYFPQNWDTLDQVVIDTGSSTATISLAQRMVRVTLARSDLDDPIVWGRWLIEKAFLILTLRSDRHYGLHAGALVLNGRGALVTADSGVGKSTFTAWGLLRGAEFVGEDAMMRHLDDAESRFWGYPRCAYLDPALIKGSPALEGARTAAVPARRKYRIEWPESFESQLRTSIYPSALLILTRDHADIRPVEVDEATEVCRSDFSAGKRDPRVLEQVESDLREQLSRMKILEFGLSPDLDINFARIKSALCD
jgi:hypothetical protein